MEYMFFSRKNPTCQSMPSASATKSQLAANLLDFFFYIVPIKIFFLLFHMVPYKLKDAHWVNISPWNFRQLYIQQTLESKWHQPYRMGLTC